MSTKIAPYLIGRYGWLSVAAGRRVKIITKPGRYDHRKVRKIADRRPYYMVEDRAGNTGLYRLDQLELA